MELNQLLQVDGLGFSYPAKKVFREISFSLSKGEILCLMGPNGCGKTTLLDTIMSIHQPDEGSITLLGEPIESFGRREIAQNIAYVPQIHHIVFPYTVEQIVLMGRTAHLGHFKEPRSKDLEYCFRAMERVGIGHLAKHPYSQLSGGEVKLVLLARALSQHTPLIIMDEPTANLDFKNELLFLESIADLCYKEGISILMATHSPEHAFYLESKGLMVKAALMWNGRMVEYGQPHRVIREENIERVYGVKIRINNDYNELGVPMKTITLLGTA